MTRHTFQMQPLEPRALLAMLPVGIDPANMGKGDWVWLVDSARQSVGASNVQELVDYLKNKGMKWIIVKAGDGNDGPNQYTQFNKDLIDRVHAAGMKIFGYHFIYGGGDPAPKVATTTPEGERAVAKQIMALNPDGLIIDAEGQYERAPNKLSTALAYGKAFKDAYPGKLLGHAPFPYVSFHRAFPYYEFGKYADVVMPQAYWKTISIAQTPEKMVDDLEREWHALYDEFRATGKHDAIKPIAPIGQGYDPGAKVTPGEEVTRFVNLLKSDTDPASPGGYKGVSFWSVQHHTASIWSAVGSATIGTPTGKINGKVFNDADLDGVRDAGEAGIANRTVYIDADNDSVMDSNEFRTKTDAAGNYSLFHLAAGTYKVRHLLGSGYRQTSPANNFGRTVTLSAGEIETGKDFGATSKALVTGTVFFDIDADGGRDSDEGVLSGWRVYDDVDRDGVWDSNEPSTTTNSTGTYRLNLSTGAKRIRFIVPSGYRGTAPASGFHDVSLSAGQTVSGRNFGATQRILVSGAVFADFNENKIRDPGDSGLPGWRVYIDLDNDSRWDTNEASVFSDASGNWRFTTLSAGTYYIKIQQQSGWRRTTQSTFLIVLGPGGVATNKLFGEKRIV